MTSADCLHRLGLTIEPERVWEMLLEAYVNLRRWRNQPRSPRADIGVKLGYRDKEAA